MIGDFNAPEFDTWVKNFCDIYSFKKLIKEPTYFKHPHNTKCIDLMRANRSRSFLIFCVIETRLCDVNKMTATVLRSHLTKLRPQTIKIQGLEELFQWQISVTYKQRVWKIPKHSWTRLFSKYFWRCTQRNSFSETKLC